MKQLLIVAAICALLVAPAASAQDQPPQYLSIFTAHVQLGHQADYEEGIKTLWAEMKKHGADFPVFASMSLSDPGSYSFVTTLPNMAAMDAQNEVFGKVFAANADLLPQLSRHSRGNESNIIAPRPDLSYSPESPRVTGEGQTFARVTYLYAKPGHAMELEGVIREFVALSAKKGIADGFAVYQNVTGEGPLYAIRTLAKSESDYYSHAEMNAAKLGEAGAALRAKAGPMIQRIEYSASVSRPDLAYQP